MEEWQKHREIFKLKNKHFGDKNGEKIKKPQFDLSLRYFIRRS